MRRDRQESGGARPLGGACEVVGSGEPDTPASDRVRPTGVTTGCVILQERAELPSRKQKAQTMTSMPETIPTPQTDPHQPTRSSSMRSALSSLFNSLTNLMEMFVCFCLEIIELFLKTCFIFLFVNLCALSILFMGDYIFCNSAHAERFTTIANIIASHTSARGVLSFFALYGIASLLRNSRTNFDTVAAMTISKPRAHTPD